MSAAALYQQLYQAVSDDVIASAKQIKLLILDVDGVFSDGRIYLGNQGEELKAFHTRDGYGIKALRKAGVEVAVITGRHSEIVAARMASLTIPYVYQGREHKVPAFEELLATLQLEAAQVAYLGDDLSDWTVMQHVGLSAAVRDAHPWLTQHANVVTHLPGGFGAVRELCDLILIAQNKFMDFSGSST